MPVEVVQILGRERRRRAYEHAGMLSRCQVQSGLEKRRSINAKPGKRQPGSVRRRHLDNRPAPGAERDPRSELARALSDGKEIAP